LDQVLRHTKTVRYPESSIGDMLIKYTAVVGDGVGLIVIAAICSCGVEEVHST